MEKSDIIMGFSKQPETEAGAQTPQTENPTDRNYLTSQNTLTEIQ